MVPANSCDWPIIQPLFKNDEVAEQHTQEEQGNHSGYGRYNASLLFGAGRGQERHLPDDRCTNNHRELKKATLNLILSRQGPR